MRTILGLTAILAAGCAQGSGARRARAAADGTGGSPRVQVDREIERLFSLAEDARKDGDPVRLACVSDLRDRAIDARDYAAESGDFAHTLASVRRLGKQADSCGGPSGGG